MGQHSWHLLPHDAAPCFPDRCPACGDSAPREIDVMMARAFHPGHLVLCFFMGRKVRLEVPYCAQCVGAVQLQRRWRSATCFLGVLVAIIVAAYLRRWVPAERQNLVYVGAALAALAPALLWKGIAPPPIEVSVEPEGLRFEFRDPVYAQHFAGGNSREAPRS
ncbi:MAG: hypothetical protein AB7O52_13810 [Planctomycetota bacterium]